MTRYGEVEEECEQEEGEVAPKTDGGVLEEERPSSRTTMEKGDGG